MRVAHDSRFSVSAAWALEFAPVNVSVVFMQSNGFEHYCIGSRSWMFEELADCVAEVRSEFPWRVAVHVIPPEPDTTRPAVWGPIFEELGLYPERAPVIDDVKRMLLAQRLLSRLYIDTAPRPFVKNGEANNQLLIDSLNGYRMKELSGFAGVYTMNPLATHERYLTRALEHYAAWDWRGAPERAWGPRPDYTQSDRAVI